MKSYQQLFAELKRRHVFRVAAIYGATAFVLLQLADLLVEALKLPADFLTMVTVLILLGFPLALVLAWAFEVTPEGGVRRVDPASQEELAEIVAQPASKRWPAGLLALAGVAALVFGAWWVGRQTATGSGAAADPAATEEADGAVRLAYADLSEDDRPSIAVLPFADMSREGDQEYFSDGMTEEILNTLAKIDELRVSARTSTFAYKDRSVDLREIGRELGVRYVVEGSVRKDGDQLRITAQLIDARDGTHLWSDAYDRTLESVFAIQTEIAQAIAEELRVPLGLDDPSALVEPVADLEAYDLYLAARSRMRERGASLTEAVRLYEAAIARDSMWAPAWAGLAEATEIRLWHADNFGGQPPDTAQVDAGLDAAESAARRALSLDPNNASALVALGSVLRDRFEWTEAEAAYRRAMALDPDNAEAHHQYAELLMALGRIDEAVVEANRAAALDPASIRLNVLGTMLRLDDRTVDAERVYERGYAVDPDRLRGGYGTVLYAQGRYEEAVEIWGPPPEMSPEEFDALSSEWVSWMRGELDAIPDTARKYLVPTDFIRLGEPDSAAVALTRGGAQGGPTGSGLTMQNLYWLWDPALDPIRSHPAVRDYMERIDLGDATVRRTPPERREVPTILRRGDEAVATP